MNKQKKNKEADDFVKAVGRALRRAGRRAREVARLHGTSIYIWRNGKVVVVKP